MNYRNAIHSAVVILSGFFLAGTSVAEVKLPSIIGDHMVLQRNQPVPIWGWADAGEKVTVSIAGQTHSTAADDSGRWQVALAPLSVVLPGDSLSLVVEGENRLELNDILVGEVWLCSGQSNMQWTVGSSLDADLHLMTSDNPLIRLVTVELKGVQTPLEDFEGAWQLCTPQTAKDFTAVGYFFGQQLQRTLNVPIGLIDNAWGGSSCEAWIRRDLLKADPLYAALMERWEVEEKLFESGESQKNFEKALAEWEKAKREGTLAGIRRPSPPENRMTGQHRPANLYNARIRPIMPFAIRGAIWYQGESNAGRAFQYRKMFPLMIQNWRDEWGQGDFPFYWVQLADFYAEKPVPDKSAWAELREAQTMTLDSLPNTGEAVIIDLGEGSDIHPRNKFDVGLRLARWALARDYGVDIAYASPRFDSVAQADGKLLVTFNDCGNGLDVFDEKEVKGFAIAGEDREWTWANAKVVGADQVEVWSDEVSEPVAIRYAWSDNPVCNLYSLDGLPVTPFRSDDWPGATDEER